MPLRRLTVHPHDSPRDDRRLCSRSTGRQKQYSIERLGALQTYTESKSMLRVVCVSVVTVAIPLLMALLLESIPLQPPEAGWSKNVSLWCRDFGLGIMSAFGTLLQLHSMAPSAELTVRKIAGIGLFTTCCYVGFAILIAKLWVFPTPFVEPLTMPAWFVAFVTATGYTIGANNFRHNTVLKTQVLRFFWLLCLEANLVLIYPVYSIGFASLSGTSQLAFLFLLPVIKFVIKGMMKCAVADYEDLVPAIVITVDFFNALYQSKCMQSSGSILATVGIIAIDMVQNFFTLYKLFGLVRKLDALLSADLRSKGVIASAIDIASQPAELNVNELLDIQVASSALELLWRCELVLLVEYVEAAIPMMYAIYLTILYQLPNAKYYPETAHVDAAALRQAIARIATYSALELISLVFVHLTLKRRFKLSPLHQLAFTLESEWLLVQGAFVTWAVVLLPYTLTHHGADFTFRFTWLT